ncbi:hypothetical protein DAY52_00900 [Salmonella enterica subsp. enterica serovar Enteritidis]|nr:hypothetical protein [Salmonella enterica subsp. enterica serovar Enteritidis]HAR9088942.1 hypothetical protein [Salmonella enterica]
MIVNDNIKKKIDEIINAVLNVVESIPATKEIKYYVSTDEVFPDLLRTSPEKIEEVKRQFELRGLKIDIVNEKHFRVTYSRENIIFSPEQPQLNLNIFNEKIGE